MEAKRVLHLPNTLAIDSGVMSVIMSYYRFIDHKRVQFDFLCFKTDKPSFESEITSSGGRIYYIPRTGNPFKLYTYLKDFFKIHATEYVAIHYHAISIWFMALRLSEQYGIRHRIAHSHATMYGETRLKKIRNSLICVPLKKQANLFFACSKMAGAFMYGKSLVSQNRVCIINNAIDVEKFGYNKGIRESLRNSLELGEKLVICHVGRFSPQKNHGFIIDIFKEIKEVKDDAVLLLVGDGPLKNNIQQKVQSLGIEEDVLFLGVRNDVHNILQAADVFLLPSIYEGLGIVLIEAQTTGLYCVASDVIPNEAKVGELLEFVSLREKPEVWASKILRHSHYERVDKIVDSRNAGFDIVNESEKLTEFYASLI